ncbi:MAG: transcription antitermination factor NusB [Negativicutes bacterium]|nr:transcription antitermination factor NusB [Negativicutes bacterium]
MSRRKAREMALQALFQLDFNETEPEVALEVVYAEFGKIGEKTRDYALKLVSGTHQEQSRIDQIIGDLSADWSVDRMAGVDRNIARMAVFELKFGTEELSPSVVINEAVELAKTFGTDDSGRFINGILGSLVRKDRSVP